MSEDTIITIITNIILTFLMALAATGILWLMGDLTILNVVYIVSMAWIWSLAYHATKRFIHK
jgi:Flp pilus assembly protein TadB